MKFTITYFASNETLGESSVEQANHYRRWAGDELRREFPDHKIIVSDENSLQTSITDDYENEEEISDFCSRLWDQAPDYVWDNVIPFEKA